MTQGRDRRPPPPAPAQPEAVAGEARPAEPDSDFAVAAKTVAALDRISRALRRHRQAAASRLGLTPLQAEILALLAEAPPPAHVVGEVATELGVRQPTVTDSAAALERKGLIVRSRLPGDRRRTGLAITVAGREVAGELSRSHGQVVSALAGMADDGATSSYVALLRIIERLVDTGIVQVARTCLTCKYFAPATGAAGRHCTLLDMPLPDEALRVNCPEHEQVESRAPMTPATPPG